MRKGKNYADVVLAKREVRAEGALLARPGEEGLVVSRRRQMDSSFSRQVGRVIWLRTGLSCTPAPSDIISAFEVMQERLASATWPCTCQRSRCRLCMAKTKLIRELLAASKWGCSCGHCRLCIEQAEVDREAGRARIDLPAESC